VSAAAVLRLSGLHCYAEERARSRLAVAAAAVLFVGLAAPSALAADHSAPVAKASAAPQETSVPTPSAPPLEPPSPTPNEWEIAEVRAGHVVTLRVRPAGHSVATLDGATEFGSPQTFAITVRKGRWLGVTTSALPNGRLGWLRLNRSLRITRTSVRLVLDLSQRQLVLFEGDRARRRMTVGVGRPSSPTPIGHFAVTDKLAGSNYGSYYGCCILALSAHQPNLPAGWRGGDRIAIHGTADPSSIGAATSAGCPHAWDSDLRVLLRLVPLGAPVFVRG
jgi:lipoprotein-anchoring transpeptidase ErfK/SrfK